MSQAEVEARKKDVEKLLYIGAKQQGLSKPLIAWRDLNIQKDLIDALILIDGQKELLEFKTEELEDAENDKIRERKV